LIATLVAAGRGRAWGLPHIGLWGVGAAADVVIYEEEPDILRMFSHPRYVLKGGEIVIEDGDVRATPQGREFLVKPAYDEAIETYLRPKFEDQYTMSFENYPVEMERLEHPEIRDCIPAE
jgi:formylmethanofuran dehydrogenase subunit A